MNWGSSSTRIVVKEHVAYGFTEEDPFTIETMDRIRKTHKRIPRDAEIKIAPDRIDIYWEYPYKPTETT